MHYRICLAHCRDYRLDNGHEKVTCWYKKQSCPVSDRQILAEATHTRFWGQAVRLSLFSIFIIAKWIYSSSRFYFYNLQSFRGKGCTFFCADAPWRGFRVLRFSMFLNVFRFLYFWGRGTRPLRYTGNNRCRGRVSLPAFLWRDDAMTEFFNMFFCILKIFREI